jgi:signal transduction histidine kinase
LALAVMPPKSWAAILLLIELMVRMPRNPWLAIDGTQPPSLRARELLRIWDEFVGKGEFDAARAPIAESWQRSQAAGVDPTTSRAPTLIADRNDVAAEWKAHPLEAAAPLIRKWLEAFADESDHVIVVSDADGLLLWLDGSAKLRSAAADRMNFVEGALWSEEGAGTNAIGTALATDHAVQVHAAEHFNEIVHAWTCSAAPVHDPESGSLLGIIDLTGPMRTAHPQSLSVALETARAVETDLRARLQERDARLRESYVEKTVSSREPLALVSPSGRVIADHPDGLLRVERFDIPPGGGELILPSGARAVAEVVGDEEGFLVRAIRGTAVRGGVEPAVSPGAERDLNEWRRAQVELSRLAEEQSVSRRVAMLVAGRAAEDEIFAVVAEGVARIVHADRGAVVQYESDDSMTVEAYWSTDGSIIPVGTRIALEGDNTSTAVLQSGRPVRVDSYEGLSGPVVEYTRTLGEMPSSTVGAPIIVAGRVWGAIFVSSMKAEPLPDDAESRIVGFTELVATAISNAVWRAELAASRTRVVAAADETRRRIERDLHDGLQQRLVLLLLELREVKEAAPTDVLKAEVSRVEAGLEDALDELREISRGIHPAILSQGGLAPALRALARRSPIPVKLDVQLDGRVPEVVEVAAYYVVSEALTNAAKHAQAPVARVAVERRDTSLHLSIHDDGAGGADPRLGSGLIGLRDRVEAIGGTIMVVSPVGAGTSLLVELPVNHPAPQSAA